jgi:hypothetical protein
MNAKAKVIGVGARTVRRHPGKAVRLSVFAIKQRRAVLMLVSATRRAAEVGSTVKEAAGNKKVQSEASSAVSSLMLAGKRARRVGVTHAPGDKQVALQLQRAGRHASKAMTAARRPKHKRPVVRTATFVTGAGALGGAAYAGWRVYARPPLPPYQPVPADGMSSTQAKGETEPTSTEESPTPTDDDVE